MGFVEEGARWVDMRFRSAFLLASAPVGSFGISARVEAFETRNRGSWWDDEYDETGWSAMLCGKRQWGRLTGLLELIHVSSDNPTREHIHLDPRQKQTRVRADLRLSL